MKKHKESKKNWVAKELSNPKYHQRIVASKVKYTRKGKMKDSSLSYLAA